MSSIRVSGNTSGHYDLTVPDVAGSNTIALDKIVVTDSNGFVGIGTNNPSAKLHIKGDSNEDAELRLFPSAADMDAVISFTGQDDNTTTEGAQIWYDNSVGDLHIVSSYDHSNGGIRFHTRQPGHKQEGNERLTITADGYVGIGYTDPNEKLHVNGYIEASSGFKLAGHPVLTYDGFDGGYATRLGSTGTSTLNATQIFAGGSVQATFKGGNVGIGTSSPDAMLTVDTNIGGNSTGTLARFHSSKGESDSTFFQIAATRYSTASVQRVQLQAFDDDGSTGRTLALNSSGGNVGVGTNTPNATLTVSQSANNIFAVERTGVVSGSGQFGINVENNSQATVSYDDGAPLVFGTASNPSTHVGFAERMKISAEGYVTKPNHPAFQAFAMGSNHGNAGGYIPFTHTVLNQGNHFSTANDRFTAPVAGVYHFHFHTFIDQGNTTTGQISFYKNGSYSFGGYEIRNYHTHRNAAYGPTMVLTATVGLNKFDYIQVYTTINLHANASNYFGGHLIG